LRPLFMSRTGPLLALCLIAAPVGAGEIEITLHADGSKIIRNEPGEARARRFSRRLVPIPDAKIAESIDRWSAERELDPLLVHAVVQVESGFNPRALSNKGAMGLMQLMPGTARELEVGDPWDPEQNVRGGTEYLRRMLERFDHDLEKALAAYNAGPEAVSRHAGIPPFAETRDYVRKILCLLGDDCTAEPERTGRPVRIVRDADNLIRITTSGAGG